MADKTLKFVGEEILREFYNFSDAAIMIGMVGVRVYCPFLSILLRFGGRQSVVDEDDSHVTPSTGDSENTRVLSNFNDRIIFHPLTYVYGARMRVHPVMTRLNYRPPLQWVCV